MTLDRIQLDSEIHGSISSNGDANSDANPISDLLMTYFRVSRKNRNLHYGESLVE